MTQASIPGSEQFRYLDLHQVATAADTEQWRVRYMLDTEILEGTRAEGNAWRIPYLEMLVAIVIARLRSQRLSLQKSRQLSGLIRRALQRHTETRIGRLIICVDPASATVEPSQYRSVQMWTLGTTAVELAELYEAAEKAQVPT